MTLDVTIGRLFFDKEVNEMNVERCPTLDYDLCDPDFTIYPRDSFRSGSIPFWDFFKKKDSRLTLLYVQMRKHQDSNDWDVTQLTPPLLISIENLPDKMKDPVDTDRVKWLKFWCKKAYELYGKEAGIKFS